MKYMLDSNMCIYLINKHPERVVQKFKLYMNGSLSISSIVLSELFFGAHNSHQKEKNLLTLAKFTIPVEVLPYDTIAAQHYGEIRAYLQKKGSLIDPLDMLIGAHARSIEATLITNNFKEFSRIPNLLCENWV